jgi:hypothetical protein
MASHMKATLFALRSNELLCCSSSIRRAERFSFLGSKLIADAECHVCSSWVDSTPIIVQPATRIIPLTFPSLNRGATGSFFDFMRSGDITPELTGREGLYQAFNLADERQANSAPVE